MMSVQGVDLDETARRVWRDGTEIRMSNKEFDLLHALISRPGEIVTREELMRGVWQTNFWTSAKTIDVHLGWVRKKLGDDTRRPTLITTIRGRGLRFEVTPPVYAELPAATASAAVAVPTSMSAPMSNPMSNSMAGAVGVAMSALETVPVVAPAASTS